MSDSTDKALPGSRWSALAILIVAAGLSYYVYSHPMDFRVYHYGARGVFDGTRPVYGPTSGLGWPMHYRYPPLFLLLFAPFALLPLGWGAVVWVILKLLVLIALVRVMVRRMTGPGTSQPATLWILPFLFIAPYIIEEFRYGNAQFFVFALTAASLLTARDRPILSAGCLALGISTKVWPLFFVPYLAARGDWRVVSRTLGFVVLLTLIPSFYFGIPGNLNLLGQWFSQEFQTQLGNAEIWFPNQSLRGVLMRYLTVLDYSRFPDSNYPQINIAAFDPGLIRFVWFIAAAAAYLALLVIAARRRKTAGWLDHGLAFCLLALLQPFTQKYALAVLLWPALVAGFVVTRSRLRFLVYIAAALVLIQPVVPGSASQRLLQVLGMDFAATALLTTALFVACLKFSDDSSGIHNIERPFPQAATIESV